MTASDFASIQDGGYKHELVAGLLVAEPFPVPRHDRVRSRLEAALRRHVADHELGEVFGETGYVLARDPDTVRGPDLSFMARERLVGFDDTKFFEGAPDLAVEILSPSNRPGEMHAKVADYLAAGTRLVWLIDPERRTVTIYGELLRPKEIGDGETLDGEGVVPGFAIAVDQLLPRR